MRRKAVIEVEPPPFNPLDRNSIMKYLGELPKIESTLKPNQFTCRQYAHFHQVLERKARYHLNGLHRKGMLIRHEIHSGGRKTFVYEFPLTLNGESAYDDSKRLQGQSNETGDEATTRSRKKTIRTVGQDDAQS